MILEFLRIMPIIIKTNKRNMAQSTATDEWALNVKSFAKKLYKLDREKKKEGWNKTRQK